ncbi:MAG: type IIA DNA topoisomerase subunit B [Bacteroidales bacterium]|nr:type IIA DNA topoisomerase subunit B [Bacteroidales bacterium]MBO6237770.1 type IIA DNA topoisomerase subunit B [Bacteroidales bacterium]MBR1488051.1 type IIA DNA topoisomerase subunit B [Bacteroidales bacterium]MBR1578444.1 type IIA DNA topoisomerase subunit B [Bacteroidales bacterium]
MPNSSYTDDNIRTLEGVQHVRMRPGMYIGRLGNGNNPGDGIYVLLKEIVDNSIDEFAMGFGKEIRITIRMNEVTVRDFGRGIPLDSVVKAVSILNTGGKFDDKVFKKSVGLNGVGTKAVNALSENFYVCSFRDGESSWARFERGELKESGKGETREKNGTLVTFTPDSMMFGEYAYNMDYVESMVKNYSYLKKGLTLNLNGTAYKSENGLLDLVNENLSDEPLYPPIHLEGEDIEIVLSHCNAYGENISSFVNGQNTRDGGTHLAAYREAIAKTLKEFFKKNYDPSDCRQGVVGAISIQIQEPNFEGQTKTKLGSNYMWEKQVHDESGALKTDIGPTIRSYVNDFVAKNLDNYLRIHKEIVPVIEDKIKASQQEREEISGIQKKTRERNKRTNVYNRKLRDCRFHYNDKVTEKTQENIENSSIFITEGDSASGTITKARNANYQAVFSLRGKPINCYKESRKKVAENEELNLLISALGVEDDLENLRYNNIIVATDADDDGMHIRMLVLTFFMKYYPDLIRRGHVHILQTPLFRVRNKKENRYCYSPEEKEKAIAALKTGVEITRFKGLGEISSDEFVHFIGPDMRLDLVKLAEEESIADIMSFYMGDNTLERQNFIRANLRSEEELEDVNI